MKNNNGIRIQNVFVSGMFSAKNVVAYLLLLYLCVSSLEADTFTVTRTDSTGPGSFSAIISQANATSGSHVIEFAVSGTITLSTPLPTLTKSFTINGRVDNPVIISGGGTVPIFTFAAGTTNFVNRLNLVNAKTASGGGAINNSGTAIVNGCLIMNCVSPNAAGGAIINAGMMTIVSATFSGNQANTGGAISSSGTLTVVSGTLSGNQASIGGAIHNSGKMSIADSRITNNQGGNGGAVYNAGTLSIERLSILSNEASLGFGGGIFNSGTIALSDSTLANNRAGGQKGGSGSGGGGGGAGLGGGIFVMSGGVRLTNCTLSSNAALGGDGANSLGGFNRGGTGGGNNAGSGGTVNNRDRCVGCGSDGGFGGGGGAGAGVITNGTAFTGGLVGDGGFGGGGGGLGWQALDTGKRVLGGGKGDSEEGMVVVALFRWLVRVEVEVERE